MLSIVVPIHNEEHSILPLYDRLTSVLVQLRRPYEIIFVDDASTDRSHELLANLVQTDQHLKVMRLRRNFGQTAALSAGFHEARGKIVIAMDGDLQHAPEDIPALLPKSTKATISPAAGAKNGSITRSPARFPRDCQLADVEGLRHRSARFRHHLQGLSRGSSEGRASLRRTASLHSRAGEFLRRACRGSADSEYAAASGDSHYGLGRTFRVLFDILTIRFLLKYFTRPMHFFGASGCWAPARVAHAGVLRLRQVLLAARYHSGHGPMMMQARCCSWRG